MSQYELLSSILGIAGFTLSLALAIREWFKARVRFKAVDGNWISFAPRCYVLDFVLVNRTHSVVSVIGADVMIGESSVSASRYATELFTTAVTVDGVCDESTRKFIISTEFPFLLAPCECARLTLQFDHDQVSHLLCTQSQGRPDQSVSGGDFEAARLFLHTAGRGVKLRVPCKQMERSDWCKQALNVLR